MLLWLPMVAFFLVTLIQLFYYLRYFRLLAFFKPKDKEFSYEHAVSVIVCARDEANEIEQNLPGVLAQSYRSTHEIVVVNDNSQDDTKFLLEGLYRDFKQLHIVELKQEAVHIPGKKFPLSMGIKSAKHEVLLLTDADCIPASENWIKNMQAAFHSGIEIVLGYGAYKKEKGILNRIIRFDTFHTALQYLSFAIGGMPYMGVGRNLAYKKELFFKQKGFAAHHHLPGGDDDLFINACANKKNTTVVLDQGAFTYSTPSRKWSEWISQKERHNATGKYYKSVHKWVLGLYMGSQFLFYPLMVVALFTFDWKWVVGLLSLKLLIQGLVFYKSMKKLGESDLFIFFPLFDLWMFFYYLIFMSSLWKTPKTHWS
jgi:glycosyltransferase involved in cell wall biosynthesis